jgi:hypothetical protein
VRRFCHLIVFLLIIPVPQLLAQERLTSISLFGSLSTSSELFHHPNDPDEILRSEYYPLNTIFGGGAEIRRIIAPLRLSVGASVEILSKSETSTVNVNGISSSSHLSTNINVPVADGYIVFPVELSVYVPLPVGTENFQIYIGGGGAAYIGDRRYSYAGLNSSATDQSTGYGIQILSGAEYKLSSIFSLRTEVKFRDVHFETVDNFYDRQTTIDESFVPLPQGPQQSRVNIDGLAMAIQLAYYF